MNDPAHNEGAERLPDDSGVGADREGAGQTQPDPAEVADAGTIEPPAHKGDEVLAPGSAEEQSRQPGHAGPA